MVHALAQALHLNVGFQWNLPFPTSKQYSHFRPNLDLYDNKKDDPKTAM